MAYHFKHEKWYAAVLWVAVAAFAVWEFKTHRTSGFWGGAFEVLAIINALFAIVDLAKQQYAGRIKPPPTNYFRGP